MTLETKTDLRRGMKHLTRGIEALGNFNFSLASNQLAESMFFLEKVARDVNMNGEDMGDEDI